MALELFNRYVIIVYRIVCLSKTIYFDLLKQSITLLQKHVWTCTLLYRNMFGHVLCFTETCLDIYSAVQKHVWTCTLLYRNMFGHKLCCTETCLDMYSAVQKHVWTCKQITEACLDMCCVEQNHVWTCTLLYRNMLGHVLWLYSTNVFVHELCCT